MSSSSSRSVLSSSIPSVSGALRKPFPVSSTALAVAPFSTVLPATPSVADAEITPHHTSIPTVALRRPGEDWNDAIAELILTPEEIRHDLMPERFWDRSNNSDMKVQHYSMLDFSHSDRNRPVTVRHTIYEIDRCADADAIRDYNGVESWSKAYFDIHTKQRANVFSSPFPRPMFHAKEKELYIDHYLDLDFSLTPFITHKQLVDRKIHNWNEKGEITLPLTNTNEFYAAFREMMDKSASFHCLPICLKLKSVKSKIPMAFQICLQSRLPSTSPRVVESTRYFEMKEREEKRAREQKNADKTKQAKADLDPKFPSHATWGNICSVNPIDGPGYYRVMPLQDRPDDAQGDILYTAPELTINHPLFTRFIGVNFTQLRQEFQAFREDDYFYKMTGEAADQVIFSSLAFWFFIEYFPLIKVITARLMGPAKPFEEWNCLKFEKDGIMGKVWVRVPVPAVEEIIHRLEKVIDQDALLMNCDELSLVIRPENGVEGWKQYTDWVNDKNKGMMSAMDNLAMFSVKLELAFEPFKLENARRPVPFSQLGMVSHSGLVNTSNPFANGFSGVDSGMSSAMAAAKPLKDMTSEELIEMGKRLNHESGVHLSAEQIQRALQNSGASSGVLTR